MPRFLPSWYSDRSIDVTDEFEFMTIGQTSRRTSLLSEIEGSWDRASEYDNYYRPTPSITSVESIDSLISQEEYLEVPRNSVSEDFATILLESDLSFFEIQRTPNERNFNSDVPHSNDPVSTTGCLADPNWYICSNIATTVQEDPSNYVFTFARNYRSEDIKCNQKAPQKHEYLIGIQIFLCLFFIFLVCLLLVGTDLLE